MQMRPHGNSDKYFELLMEDSPIDESLFLGSRRLKGSKWLILEDNIINSTLLGFAVKVEDDRAKLTEEESRGLLDYQIEDVNRMIRTKHILNANPMGLGKTVETIVAMKTLGVRNALIVVPKSVMLQWKEQIAVWWPEMYDNTKVLPTKFSQEGISILNYERLVNEVTLTKVKSFRWDVLVCDEAHRIKNQKSKRTLAVKSIPAERRWALTGTPILNKPDDLWSILHFLDVRYSGKSYWAFVEHFCKIVEGFWGRKLVGLTDNPSNEALLQSMLARMCIRNSEVEVGHGKLEGVVKVQMGAKHKKLYASTRDLILEELPDTISIPNGAVHVLRLQQLTSWPGLFEAGMHGAKFEWIKDLVEDNPGDKIVVFTKFAKSAAALARYLDAGGDAAVLYIGDMSPVERDLSVYRFLHEPATRVLIGTIGAMGQGVDGLQKASRVVVFLDRDWSPELMKQAEGRLCRMGQEKQVIVHYLECAGSFDQHVGRVNMTKTEDIRRALSDD